MNKLGIKVYPDRIYTIDAIHYKVNSIKYESYVNKYIYIFRTINFNKFGIKLYIIKK